MEEFHTVIDYNPEVEYLYNDLTQNFSENKHSKTVERGINPIKQKWSVKVSSLIPKVNSAHNFIVTHLGTRRFKWTTPHGENILVRCKEMDISFSTPLSAELSMVFEQAFEP